MESTPKVRQPFDSNKFQIANLKASQLSGLAKDVVRSHATSESYVAERDGRALALGIEDQTAQSVLHKISV